MSPLRTMQGFTLMEVLIAVSLSTLLTSGIVQLVAGSVSAYRLQLSQSQLDESSRYAREVLTSYISQAGYRSRPWDIQTEIEALTSDSLDGDELRGDQLGLQRWSQRNCYGNDNPVTDSNGQPEFYLLRVRLFVNTTQNLAISCRYGADAAQLQIQINSFGLVEDIESMQVLYSEDTDGDHIADTWVNTGGWKQERNIREVKVALLLATEQAFEQPRSRDINLLDETITTPADGRLRKVSYLTAAIRGRLE